MDERERESGGGGEQPGKTWPYCGCKWISSLVTFKIHRFCEAVNAPQKRGSLSSFSRMSWMREEMGLQPPLSPTTEAPINLQTHAHLHMGERQRADCLTCRPREKGTSLFPHLRRPFVSICCCPTTYSAGRFSLWGKYCHHSKIWKHILWQKGRFIGLIPCRSSIRTISVRGGQTGTKANQSRFSSLRA